MQTRRVQLDWFRRSRGSHFRFLNPGRDADDAGEEFVGDGIDDISVAPDLWSCSDSNCWGEDRKNPHNRNNNPLPALPEVLKSCPDTLIRFGSSYFVKRTAERRTYHVCWISESEV